MTYYYNYGSAFPDGYEGYECWGGHFDEGDQTPANGELKAVESMHCDTFETTVDWYRYHDPGCVPAYWQWIPEPVYYREWYC